MTTRRFCYTITATDGIEITSWNRARMAGGRLGRADSPSVNLLSEPRGDDCVGQVGGHGVRVSARGTFQVPILFGGDFFERRRDLALELD